MKKKIFCFDIDGVICKTSKNNYSSSTPIIKTIKIINELYLKNRIIIFTSRYMGRNNENVKKARAQGYKKTLKQLKSWGLKFHKLVISKLAADIYIDDKSYGYNKNWKKKFKNYLK